MQWMQWWQNEVIIEVENWAWWSSKVGLSYFEITIDGG